MEPDATFDERQRNTLIVLGALVAIVAIVVVIVFALRDDTSTPVAVPTSSTFGSGSSTTASKPSTTVVDPNATTTTTVVGGGTTSLPGVTTTVGSSIPGSTSTAVSNPIIGTSGAVLSPPKPGDNTAPYNSADGCQSLAEAGYVSLCGVAHTTGGDLIWVTERASTAPNGQRAFLYSVAGNQATIQLAVLDDSAVNFASIGVRVVDLTGDGADEIVFGFRSLGTGKYLDIDFVGGKATVIGHRSLDHGSVKITNGKFEAWSALFAPTDADCCPSKAEHSAVGFADGSLRLIEVEIVPSAQVPASEL